MICFEFAHGRVSWNNRWVRTEEYELERAVGKSLFGVLGNLMTADPAVASKHYNTANTHIVWHDNRMMALMEGTIVWLVDGNDAQLIFNRTVHYYTKRVAENSGTMIVT